MDKITTNGYIFIANTLKSRGYEVNEDDVKNFFDNSGDVSITDASKELGKYVAQNNSGKELSKEDSAILDNVLAEIDKSENKDKTLSATELSNNYTYETSKTSDKATTDTTSNTTVSATSGVTIPMDDKGTGTLELVYDSDGNPKVNVYTKSGELLTTRNVRPSEVEKFNAAGANIDTTSTTSSGSTATTSSGTTTTATAPKSTGLASPATHDEIPDGLTLETDTFTYKDENGTEYVKCDNADIGNAENKQEKNVDDDTYEIYLSDGNGNYTYAGFRHRNADQTWSYFIQKDSVDAMKASSKLGAENKKPADVKLEQLDELYQAAKDEQGWVGKFFNGFKNLFYTQYSESRIQDEIEALRTKAANGEEITQEEIDAIKEKVETYRDKSDKQVTSAGDTAASLAGSATGVAVFAKCTAVGTALGGPVGTVAGLIVGGIAAFAVGALAKVAVEQVENGTDKIKGNSLQNDEDLGKQVVTGGFTAVISAGLAGIGKVFSKFTSKLFGFTKLGNETAQVVVKNGVVDTGKTVLTHAAAGSAAGATTGFVGAEAGYILDCATDEDREFNLSEAAQVGATGAGIGAAVGLASGTITGVKNVNAAKNIDLNAATKSANKSVREANKGVKSAQQKLDDAKAQGKPQAEIDAAQKELDEAQKLQTQAKDAQKNLKEYKAATEAKANAKASATGNNANNTTKSKNPLKRFGNWLKNKFGRNKNTQTPDNSQTTGSTDNTQTQKKAPANAQGTDNGQPLTLPPAVDPTLPSMDELRDLAKLAFSQNQITGLSQPFYQCSALNQREQYILGEYFNGQITNNDLAKDPTLVKVLKEASEKAFDYWTSPNW